MNPYQEFTENERNLLEKVTRVENRDYTKEETKKIENDIFEEIFLKSFKNGDMDKARMEYSNILEKLEKIN